MKVCEHTSLLDVGGFLLPGGVDGLLGCPLHPAEGFKSECLSLRRVERQSLLLKGLLFMILFSAFLLENFISNQELKCKK